jgi:hypothetical protein
MNPDLSRRVIKGAFGWVPWWVGLWRFIQSMFADRVGVVNVPFARLPACAGLDTRASPGLEPSQQNPHYCWRAMKLQAAIGLIAVPQAQRLPHPVLILALSGSITQEFQLRKMRSPDGYQSDNSSAGGSRTPMHPAANTALAGRCAAPGSCLRRALQQRPLARCHGLHHAEGHACGRQAQIHAERDRKLEEARLQRQLRRRQAAPGGMQFVAVSQVANTTTR